MKSNEVKWSKSSDLNRNSQLENVKMHQCTNLMEAALTYLFPIAKELGIVDSHQ